MQVIVLFQQILIVLQHSFYYDTSFLCLELYHSDEQQCVIVPTNYMRTICKADMVHLSLWSYDEQKLRYRSDSKMKDDFNRF